MTHSGRERAGGFPMGATDERTLLPAARQLPEVAISAIDPVPTCINSDAEPLYGISTPRLLNELLARPIFVYVSTKCAVWSQPWLPDAEQPVQGFSAPWDGPETKQWYYSTACHFGVGSVQMAEKIIFLSHIHEERELAGYIKAAIEDEFSGFVDVFVSSDGVSIPAGSNFLRRIEDGLMNCIGAIYLISPKSVNRNWVNFELGAIWIRNSLNLKAGEKEIPTLPICHSGIEPSGLPNPINALNAVRANEPAGLKFALTSLQAAVGGKGVLKTDIDALVTKVLEFEKNYTVDANVIRALEALGLSAKDRDGIRDGMRVALSSSPMPEFADFGERIVESHLAPTLYDLADGALNGILLIEVSGTAMGFQGGKPVSGPNLKIKIKFSVLASALKL